MLMWVVALARSKVHSDCEAWICIAAIEGEFAATHVVNLGFAL
jgi:hypothetical protein